MDRFGCLTSQSTVAVGLIVGLDSLATHSNVLF